MLREDEISEEATDVLRVLVPKDTKPTTRKNFRSISLCKVSVKLVTKVMANRLKMLLKELITPNRASFIPETQS